MEQNIEALYNRQDGFARKRKAQAGVTLTELVIVLLIALLIFTAIARNADKSHSSSKLLNTEQNLLIMRSEIQRLFSGSTDYSQLNNTLVLQAGLAPKDLIRGQNLVNAWGGDVSFSANAGEATWSVSFTHIPREECTKLSTFQPEAWFSVMVNGTDVSGGDVAAAANSCTETNTIVFTSR